MDAGHERKIPGMRSVSLKLLTLWTAAITLSSCAGASAERLSASPPTPPPGVQWVDERFHGAGLVVTLDHPAAWASQLQPLSIHYSATFGYLANFPLQQFCSRPSSSSFECTWADAGHIPIGGMLVTFGVEGYGPGPGIPAYLLSRGTPTTIDGRRAAEQAGPGSGCLGVGAGHSIAYFVDDGPTGGVFDIEFCWAGNSPALSNDAHAVASRLTLRPEPTNAGPFPN